MKAKRLFSNNEKQALIQKFITSGKSKNSWCRENNIPLTTFYGWLKKNSNPSVQETKTTFIQVKPLSMKDLSSDQQYENKSKSPLILEIGKCKISIPQNISISHLDDVLKVVVRLDL